MRFSRLGLAATIAIAATAAAFAQQGVSIKDLDADRIDANQIEIEFEYDGSACEQVGPAVPGAIADGALAVTFPTEATAETCTQQVVEIEVEQAIQADETVTRVDLTLTGPDGAVIATASSGVDLD